MISMSWLRHGARLPLAGSCVTLAAVQPEMDRSVRKILSLPLFGDDFCQWLVDLRMAQFEKLCAASDGTIDECVQAFVNLVEAHYSPAQQKTEEEHRLLKHAPRQVPPQQIQARWDPMEDPE